MSFSIKDLEKANAIVVPKENSPLMKFIGFFSSTFMEEFWTTWRLPFQKKTRIGYPPRIKQWEKHTETLQHELTHVEQFTPWYGPLLVFLLIILFPLPVLFSGRWFVERHAYLGTIKRGYGTVDQVVDILWNSYGWCWPKPLMKKWFEEQLKPR